KPGTGIIAGGVVRVICELAGIKNVAGKIQGRSSNKINVSEATMNALKSLKPRRQKEVVATTREVSVQEKPPSK
ncbi:MAG: 30S ribosomal protein S5, partial [Candidatus Azambacteria bacterium]|nr:30S ribosomal protein S5 [Candidatus Azambacteria bacterium]